VSGLLLMVAVLSLYVELQHPGISVAGGLALVCFAILFGSRYLIGMAAWWEIAAFAVGLTLIVVEVFVIPGFGVAGVLGIILCLLGLVAMIIPNAPNELPIPRSSLDWDVFSRSLLALCLGFIGAFVAIPILARILPRIPMANRLVLTPPSGDLGGSATERAPVLTIQPGQVGVLTTPCRPAGKARFGEEIIDVSSEGLFLTAGDKVRVLHRQGNQVVIEPVDLTGESKGGA
jgi:membrane-bound serine protease (ClpP class)